MKQEPKLKQEMRDTPSPPLPPDRNEATPERTLPSETETEKEEEEFSDTNSLRREHRVAVSGADSRDENVVVPKKKTQARIRHERALRKPPSRRCQRNRNTARNVSGSRSKSARIYHIPRIPFPRGRNDTPEFLMQRESEEKEETKFPVCRRRKRYDSSVGRDSGEAKALTPKKRTRAKHDQVVRQLPPRDCKPDLNPHKRGAPVRVRKQPARLCRADTRERYRRSAAGKKAYITRLKNIVKRRKAAEAARARARESLERWLRRTPPDPMDNYISLPRGAPKPKIPEDLNLSWPVPRFPLAESIEREIFYKYLNMADSLSDLTRIFLAGSNMFQYFWDQVCAVQYVSLGVLSTADIKLPMRTSLLPCVDWIENNFTRYVVITALCHTPEVRKLHGIIDLKMYAAIIGSPFLKTINVSYKARHLLTLLNSRGFDVVRVADIDVTALDGLTFNTIEIYPFTPLELPLIRFLANKVVLTPFDDSDTIMPVNNFFLHFVRELQLKDANWTNWQCYVLSFPAAKIVDVSLNTNNISLSFVLPRMWHYLASVAKELSKPNTELTIFTEFRQSDFAAAIYGQNFFEWQEREFLDDPEFLFRVRGYHHVDDRTRIVCLLYRAHVGCEEIPSS